MRSMTLPAVGLSQGTTGLKSMLPARLEQFGEKPELLSIDEYFPFGASTMACVLALRLGVAMIEVKAAVVRGELPLCLSRPMLARGGMVMNVATNRADFNITETDDDALTLLNRKELGIRNRRALLRQNDHRRASGVRLF